MVVLNTSIIFIHRTGGRNFYICNVVLGEATFRSQHRVYINAIADTATALLAPFASRRPAGLLLIGPATAALTPDLVIKTTPADERRAYDALEHGSDAAALLTDKPVKPRHDEAELARLRQIPATDTSVDDDPPPPAKPTPPAPPPSLIDSALQRAVQMHRALLALRKLPAG